MSVRVDAPGVEQVAESKFERVDANDRAAMTEACRPGLKRPVYPI